MNPLKLLILNDNDFNSGFGGQASFIKNLHPYLSREYVITYLILPKILWKQHLIPKRFLYLMRVLFYLWGHKRKFTFILSHTPEASFVVSFFDIPFVHIFHGNTNALEKSVYWYGKYFKWVFRYFEKRIIERASNLYTVGDYRPDAKKIYNPVEISETILQGRPGKVKDFVFAGRLEELKRVDLIIKVYSHLPEHIRETHKLHIIGSGTQESKLKKMVHEFDLDRNVIFHGLVQNERAIGIIGTSAILLMASLFEGFPMVIAESLTVGVPVIATNVGDIHSIVKDSYNGFLVPVNFSVDEYVQRIIMLLNDYDSFSRNAMESSKIFNAGEVATSFINDCHKFLNVSN